jgi:hypothetical protein
MSIRNRKKRNKRRGRNKKEKLVTFTYIGKEAWYITKLSEKTTFMNSLYSTAKILAYRNTNFKDKCKEGEIYQLICPNCEKKYVGLTGRFFYK